MYLIAVRLNYTYRKIGYLFHVLQRSLCILKWTLIISLTAFASCLSNPPPLSPLSSPSHHITADTKSCASINSLFKNRERPFAHNNCTFKSVSLFGQRWSAYACGSTLGGQTRRADMFNAWCYNLNFNLPPGHRGIITLASQKTK